MNWLERLRAAKPGAYVQVNEAELAEVAGYLSCLHVIASGPEPWLYGRRVTLRPVCCTQCGAPFQPTDTYCSYCGTP